MKRLILSLLLCLLLSDMTLGQVTFIDPVTLSYNSCPTETMTNIENTGTHLTSCAVGPCNIISKPPAFFTVADGPGVLGWNLDEGLDIGCTPLPSAGIPGDPLVRVSDPDVVAGSGGQHVIVVAQGNGMIRSLAYSWNSVTTAYELTHDNIIGPGSYPNVDIDSDNEVVLTYQNGDDIMLAALNLTDGDFVCGSSSVNITSGFPATGVTFSEPDVAILNDPTGPKLVYLTFTGTDGSIERLFRKEESYLALSTCSWTPSTTFAAFQNLLTVPVVNDIQKPRIAVGTEDYEYPIGNTIDITDAWTVVIGLQTPTTSDIGVFNPSLPPIGPFPGGFGKLTPASLRGCINIDPVVEYVNQTITVAWTFQEVIVDNERACSIETTANSLPGVIISKHLEVNGVPAVGIPNLDYHVVSIFTANSASLSARMSGSGKLLSAFGRSTFVSNRFSDERATAFRLEAPTADLGISIIPNPASSLILLEGGSNEQVSMLTIRGLDGKTYIEKSDFDSSEAVSITDLEEGIYIANYLVGQEWKSEKFVVAR